MQRTPSLPAPAQARPNINTPLTGNVVARPTAPPRALPNRPTAPHVQPKLNPQTRPSAPRPPAPRPPAAPVSPPRVVQAKYDVLISTQIPKDKQKDLIIDKVTITDRPTYPEKIKGVFQFGKDNEKGHTVAWNVLKLHHENKYKGKTIKQAADDLNSEKKKEVTAVYRAVEPTIDDVQRAMKTWVEYKHKQEIVYWDSSGENKGRGGFFGGVKTEYEYYWRREQKKKAKGEKLDTQDANLKRLYQKLMVLSAVDFQEGDTKKIKNERVDRTKRKLNRVYNDDFDWVSLNKWSGEVDDLRKYKNRKKREITAPPKRKQSSVSTTSTKRRKKN